MIKKGNMLCNKTVTDLILSLLNYQDNYDCKLIILCLFCPLCIVSSLLCIFGCVESGYSKLWSLSFLIYSVFIFIAN